MKNSNENLYIVSEQVFQPAFLDSRREALMKEDLDNFFKKIMNDHRVLKKKKNLVIN
jgi:hypothetical protein